jgi:hypothetical protein
MLIYLDLVTIQCKSPSEDEIRRIIHYLIANELINQIRAPVGGGEILEDAIAQTKKKKKASF